jgi:DNA-binding NtrC family response regulator
VPELSADLRDALLTHDWPGNVADSNTIEPRGVIDGQRRFSGTAARLRRPKYLSAPGHARMFGLISNSSDGHAIDASGKKLTSIVSGLERFLSNVIKLCDGVQIKAAEARHQPCC